MDRKTFNQSGRSAAAPIKNTPSAQELAEMFMTSRHDFLGLEMEDVTNEWNLNYIFDFLYYIRDEKQIDSAIAWLDLSWEEKHHVYDSYTNVSDVELDKRKSEFSAQLQFIKAKLMERFEYEKHKKELKAQMLLGFSASTFSKQQDEPNIEEVTQTDVPEYHIEDLTKDSQNILLIEDDEIFSQLTEISRNEIWPWIKKNRLKSANAVRFVFRYLGFIARKCSVLKFTNLFNQMVPDANLKPDTVSSYEDANIDDFGTYDKMEKWKPLKRDAEVIIKMLQPLINSQEAA